MRPPAVLALPMLAACWLHEPPPPSPIENIVPARRVASAPTPNHRAGFPTEWSGRYDCAQGPTAVRFSAHRTCGRSEHDRPTLVCSIEGVFEFGPLPENPGVPNGSYRITGATYVNGRGDTVLWVLAGEWIDQPAGYIPVGFEATGDADYGAMHGKIDEPSCGEITLMRDGRP